MAVPILLKLITIVLDIRKKKGVQQPYMVGIVPFQKVQPFKAGEKCSPATGKVSPTLQPEAFYAGVVCGTKICKRVMNQ